MKRASMLVLALASAWGSAGATENGGLGIYPDGLENFMSGALPPPGVYGIVYAGSLRYDSVRDGAGNAVAIPNFGVRVNVIAPRLVWVSHQSLLGGQLAFHVVAPLVDVDMHAGAGRWKSQGLGDMTIGAALGYHASDSLHYLAALDVVAPTGDYKPTDPSSAGKNYWTVQPVFALSQVQARGWNVDLKAIYDLNGTNHQTGTRSGQALHADYALGWGCGNGWVVGVGGHVYRQVGADSGPGAAGKARAFALGPALKYDSGRGWFLTAKLQREFDVRNRPRGEQAYVKAVLPL
ncbi:transporter [Massilia terrae]|uniref:Transporter n=1 Tax=Massilia terrae TaxID=1811224 RepID=A0ABT2CT91_9BURK|nr:transporter [Massilia terrae]MCS0657194.1 transporter [Massilia terrae]